MIANYKFDCHWLSVLLGRFQNVAMSVGLVYPARMLLRMGNRWHAILLCSEHRRNPEKSINPSSMHFANDSMHKANACLYMTIDCSNCRQLLPVNGHVMQGPAAQSKPISGETHPPKEPCCRPPHSRFGSWVHESSVPWGILLGCPIAAAIYIEPVQPLHGQSLAMRMAVEHPMHHRWRPPGPASFAIFEILTKDNGHAGCGSLKMTQKHCSGTSLNMMLPSCQKIYTFFEMYSAVQNFNVS